MKLLIKEALEMILLISASMITACVIVFVVYCVADYFNWGGL